MKAVIIGAGTIGLQHLRALRRTPDAEVAAVCDLSPAVAEAAAERAGVPEWFTDHGKMLERIRPDVVHVTTPPTSHLRLALDALEAGAHVLVEKPITLDLDDWTELRAAAEAAGRWIVEDQNYRFDPSIRRVRALIDSGEFGELVHVEATYSVAIAGPASPFGDPNLPHPCLDVPGGPIADFLPHLAYLVDAFAGELRRVRTHWAKTDPKTVLPYDEFRALIEGSRATAAIAFSAHAQPDGFRLALHGTRMTARMDLFEGILTLARVGSGPAVLQNLRNALAEGRAWRRGALRSFRSKLAGAPGLFTGLFELVRELYAALAAGGEPPVTPAQIERARRLIAALVDDGNRL